MKMTGDREFTTFVIEAISNATNVEHVNPAYHFNLIKADPDDNKFVDCAITAGADYIVTEDSHFEHLKKIPFPQLNVLTLDEFNETLKQQ